MKLWIKIQTVLELWAEAIERWWDTHLCAISRTAARQIVLERDMLRDQLEELEDSSATDYEKLTDENTYLKDELAYEHMRNKRLEDELQTVRDRDYKDIYPGLQAENKRLLETVEELRAQLVKEIQMRPDSGWTVELVKDEVSGAEEADG